jgi:hypothetical protein
MTNFRRLSLILTVVTALLVPSLASAYVGHRHRCRSGYHQKITHKHHKRKVACVKTRATKHHPTKPAPTAPVTKPAPTTTPVTNPPTTTPTTTNPPTTTTPSDPTPTPAPSATPPPPPPPPFASPADRAAAAVKVKAADASGPAITVQGQVCEFGSVSRGFPTVGSPSGSYVFTVDELWARPENGSTWHMDATGDYWWNGTNRPVFDWYDYRTGDIGGSGTMDSWSINSGWYVTIVQYVWVNGTWYSAIPPEGCAF